MTKNVSIFEINRDIPEVLIGADPEIFVKDAKGINVSAHGLVKGTKEHPLKVKNGAVQVDGTALEFNINPARNSKEFVSNIQTVMKQLADMVKTVDPGLQFDIKPAVVYRPEIFKAIPEEALELGCEPDYNAWTGQVNPRPDAAALKGLETLRTGSGHIHIGWTNGQDKSDPAHFEDCCVLTQYLDNILGHASRFWDKDHTRARLYGAPGAFRPKPYGMEYRVLSNEWLKSPELCTFVHDVTKRVTQMLLIYGAESIKRFWKPVTMGFTASNYPYYWASLFPSAPGESRRGRPGWDYTDFRNRLPDRGQALDEINGRAA